MRQTVHRAFPLIRRATVRVMMAAVAATLCPSFAEAQTEPAGKNGAAVSVWAENLAGPQGLARNERGEVFVVEHDAGRVLRFSSEGSRIGVLAEGLLAPSWALRLGDALYVAERKGNSVARITDAGAVTRLPGEVIDPLGLAVDPRKPGALLVVSHRQSLVRRFTLGSDPAKASLHAEPVVLPAEGAKYGWRDLAIAPDGTLYVTDEVSRAVLRQKPGEPVREWIGGLSSPSGLAFSPSGELYVTEEGTGRVSRLTADGKVVVLAEGLGLARAGLFLDARTLLVTDRKGGRIWKVVLPA